MSEEKEPPKKGEEKKPPELPEPIHAELRVLEHAEITMDWRLFALLVVLAGLGLTVAVQSVFTPLLNLAGANLTGIWEFVVNVLAQAIALAAVTVLAYFFGRRGSRRDKEEQREMLVEALRQVFREDRESHAKGSKS